MKFVNRLLPRFPAFQIRWRKLPVRDILYGLAAVIVGLFIARLIVMDLWHIAAVVIFAVPAIIVLQRYPFLSIVVWLAIDPFLMTATSSWERQVYWVIHRALPLFTLALILLPSALGMSTKKLPKLGFPEMLMGIYVLESLVSVWYNNLTPLATTYLVYDRIIVPICLYLIVRLSSPDERAIRWLVPVMFFVALSQTAIGTLAWIAPGALPAKWVDYENQRTIGTLINTNAYITTLILSGFISLHYGLQLATGRLRTMSILTFLLTVYCIFIAFSRAGWLAGLLALGGLFFIYPRFLTRLGLIILPAFLIVAALFLQTQIRWAGERLMSERSENSALSRVPVYAAAVRMFQAKPVFGWGYGNFDRFDRQFQNPPVANIPGDNKDHASHNFFLSMLAEQGLVGIFAFLGPLFYWLGSTIKHFSKMPRGGFWSRKILVIFWMTLLSHFVVYNFANMRVVFGLGAWWLTLGLIARFMDAHQYRFARQTARSSVSQQVGSASMKREQV